MKTEAELKEFIETSLPPLTNYLSAAYYTGKLKGFWDTKVPLEYSSEVVKLALVMTEVSEAIESIRNNEGDERLTEELADVVIRLFDFCGGYELNITKAIQKKMLKNLERPTKHGKLF